MHIGNFSMVIALFLIFPVRAQVPGGGEEAERLKQKALALMDEGRVKEAAATFREALKSAPRDLETLNDLGVALRKTGDFAGSLDVPEPPRECIRGCQRHRAVRHYAAPALDRDIVPCRTLL